MNLPNKLTMLRIILVPFFVLFMSIESSAVNLLIALVIFSVWRPSLSIIGSILFGFLYVIPTYIPGITVSTKKLFEMLPYVVTILVLVITSIRDKKENQPPAGLGLPYFREER